MLYYNAGYIKYLYRQFKDLSGNPVNTLVPNLFETLFEAHLNFEAYKIRFHARICFILNTVNVISR